MAKKKNSLDRLYVDIMSERPGRNGSTQPSQSSTALDQSYRDIMSSSPTISTPSTKVHKTLSEYIKEKNAAARNSSVGMLKQQEYNNPSQPVTMSQYIKNRMNLSDSDIQATKLNQREQKEYRVAKNISEKAANNYIAGKKEELDSRPANNRALLDRYSRYKDNQLLNLQDKLTAQERDELDSYVARNGIDYSKAKVSDLIKQVGHGRSREDLTKEYLKNKEAELRARQDLTERERLENNFSYRAVDKIRQAPIVGGVLAPAVGTIAYISAKMAGELEGARNIMSQSNSDEILNPNKFKAAESAQALRLGTSKAVRNNFAALPVVGNAFKDENSTASKALDFGTGVAMDAINSSAQALTLGAASLPGMMMNAANQDLAESSRNPNVTKEQALTSAVLHGIAEGFFEKFSIEGLQSLKQTPASTWKALFANVMKQMGIEGSEESATELANTITDSFVKGEYDRYMAEQQAEGVDHFTAHQNYIWDKLGNIVLSGVGGALSGGLSAGIANYVGTREAGHNYKAQELRDIAESADTSTELGQTIQKLASRQANELENGRSVSKMDAGFLGNQLNESLRQTMEMEPEEYINQDSVEDSRNQEEDAPDIIADQDARKAVANEFGNTPENLTGAQQAAALFRENEYKNERASIMKKYAEHYDENGKKALIENFNPEKDDFQKYVLGMNDAYAMGRFGAKAEERTIRAASYLTEEQFQAGWKAGHEDYKLSNLRFDKYFDNYKERQEKRIGGVANAIPEAPKNLVDTLETLGKKTGLIFYVTDSGKGYQGRYESGKGVITIDLSSKNPLATVSHEMTHWIQEYAPTQYVAFRDAALKSIVRSRDVELDTLMDQYREKYGHEMSNDEIMDEIAADSTGEFLNDEEFIREVTSKDRAVGQRVVEWLNSMIDAVKSLIKGEGLSKAAKALKNDLAMYEQAREYWLEGIDAASERFENYELEPMDNDKFKIIVNQGMEEDLRKTFTEIKNSGASRYERSHVWVDNISSFWKDNFGFTETPVVMQAEHIYTIMNSEEKAKRDGRYKKGANYHELSASMLEAAVHDVENPAMVIKSNSDEDNHRLVVITNQRDEKHNTIIVALDPEGFGRFGYPIKMRDANAIVSAYGKDTLQTFVRNAYAENRILYFDKARWNNITEGWMNKPYAIEKSNFDDYRKEYRESLNPDTKKEPETRMSPGSNSPTMSKSLASDENVSQESGESKGKFRHQIGIDDKDSDYRSYFGEGTLEEKYENISRAFNAQSDMLLALKDYTPSERDIHKVARNVLQEYPGMNEKELFGKLQTVYNELRRVADHDLNAGEVADAFTAIAYQVIDQTDYKDPAEQDAWDSLRKTMRNTRIYMDSKNISDLAPDGFGAFRKEWFGKVRFVNNPAYKENTGLQQYEQLHQLHPDVFTRTDLSNDSDAIEAILEDYRSAEPQKNNPFKGATRDEQAFLLSQKFWDAQFELGDQSAKAAYTKTVKQMYADFEQDIKSQYVENLQKAKNNYNQKIEENTAELKSAKDDMRKFKIMKSIDVYREKQAIRETNRERIRRSEDNKKRARLKNEIVKNVTNMRKTLEKPTDRKHIPLDMAEQIVDVLTMIDTRNGENTFRSENFLENQKSFGAMKDSFGSLRKKANDLINGNGIIEDGKNARFLTIDPDLVARMDQYEKDFLSSETAGQNLNEMSTYDLENVNNMLVSIRKLVESANEFMSEGLNQKVEDMAQKSFVEVSKLKALPQFSGKIAGAMNRILNEGMLDSYTYFHRLGEAGDVLHEATNQAMYKKQRLIKEGVDFFDDLKEKSGVTDKDIRTWQRQRHTISLDGKEVDITVPQLMSLYLLNKRGQARLHMYNKKGGIELEAFDRGNGILSNDTTVYKVNEAAVAQYLKLLTPEQKQIADGIGKFLTDTTSAWGNETSMKMYGYMKFTARDYFPIKVDQNGRPYDSVRVSDGTTMLKNMGMTKSTNDKASNPLIVQDIFAVFGKSMDDMSSYNAYVPVINDLQKWYNYMDEDGVGVKKVLREKFGADGLAYFENYIRDLNGDRANADAYDKDLYAFAGIAKGAAVGANLRVAIQQPTAYFRAANVIEAKYLPSGFTLSKSEIENQYELLTEYAPIAAWKEMGGFDINVGHSLDEMLYGNKLGVEGKLNEIRNKSMTLAEWGDKITWTWIWRASQNKVADTMPNIEVGSEQFYQESAKIFNDIIQQTQVVDSVNTRTDMMKSKSGAVKAYTAFMSEPSKSYNMLYRAVWDVAQNWETTGKAKAVKALKRAVAVHVITNFVTAACSALISTMRKRRNEENKDKAFLEIYVAETIDAFLDGVNPLGMIPLVKDIMNVVNGYSSSDMNLQSFVDIVDSMGELRKYATGESKYDALGMIYHASKIANAAGVPLYNAMRDAGAVIDTLFGNNTAFQWAEQDALHSFTYTSKSGEEKNQIGIFLPIVMKAYAEGNIELGDRYMEILKEEIGEDKVDKAMNNYMKKDARFQAILADPNTREENTEALVESGYDREDVDKYIDNAFVDQIKEEPEYEAIQKDFESNQLQDIDKQKKSLVNKGYTEEQAEKAAKNAIDKLAPFGTMEEYVTLIYEGKATKEDVRKFTEYQKKLGKTDKDIQKSARAALTAKYKKLYIAGDAKTRSEIINRLMHILVGGKQLYSEKDFQSWNKDIKK